MLRATSRAGAVEAYVSHFLLVPREAFSPWGDAPISHPEVWGGLFARGFGAADDRPRFAAFVSAPETPPRGGGEKGGDRREEPTAARTEGSVAIAADGFLV